MFNECTSILDVGCGLMQSSSYLINSSDDQILHGIDIDENLINYNTEQDKAFLSVKK